MINEKIVFFVQRWSSGGMEGIITEIINNFPVKDKQIEIVTVQKEESVYDKKLENNNVRIVALNNKNIRNALIRNVVAFKKYREYIKNNKNIVLHVNIYNAISNLYVKLIPKNCVKKVIVHAHNCGFDNDKFLIKKILNEISKVIFNVNNVTKIACSKAAASFCFKNGKTSDEIIIIKNAIDNNKFFFDDKIRTKKLKEFGLENSFIVGNIGRLVPQKNQLRLIDIFYEIKKHRKNAVLLIVGDGPKEDEICKKLEKNGLNSSFILLKNRKDINELLNMMDCFIFPSLYEGFGIVALEAQATGLPTFISKDLPKEIFATNSAIPIDLNKNNCDIAKTICMFDYNLRKNNKLEDYSIKKMSHSILELY